MGDAASQDTIPANFHQVSPELALFVADEDTLPPDVCPDLIPAGWRLAPGDQPEDFQFLDGTWVEVYILERDQ